jgi:hypothetical protein
LEARGKGIAGVSNAGLLPAYFYGQSAKGQNFPDLIGVVHRLRTPNASRSRRAEAVEWDAQTAIFPALSRGDHE